MQENGINDMEYIDTNQYVIDYAPFIKGKSVNQLLNFDAASYNPLGVPDIYNNVDMDYDVNLDDVKFNNLFTHSAEKTDTSTTTNTTPSATSYSNIGNFNINNAVQELHKNVNYQLVSGLGHITNENEHRFSKKDPNRSGHRCGVSVRLALDAGGLKGLGVNSGGNFGPVLLRNGWVALPADATPQAGDVAVTKPHGKHKDGHVSMYDGTLWVSDFFQNSKFVYTSANDKNTTVYRYKG